jgi:hypothetical protein
LGTLERELLSDGTSLARDGPLPLLDRGDQLVLAQTGDAGNAQLTGQLAQFSHHHSGQPATATRHRSVVRRRHSRPSFVGWALVRRCRSSNLAAQHVDIAHAGPS